MPSAPSSQLFPAVVDASTLGQKLTAPIFLPIGIEGRADVAGDATAAVLYSISRTDQAAQKFGPASRMTALISALLVRGAGPILAVASKVSASTPSLGERQTAWALLESDPNCRLRLTDSVSQADLNGLAVSCQNANLIDHKQVALVGLASGTAKAGLLSGASAVAGSGSEAAKRSVIIGPGVYDQFGTLQDGGYAAAAVAAEVAKNGDPSNDLDWLTLPLLTSIELDTSAMPLLREKVVSGAAVNDFEDLLQGGFSPLAPSDSPGGVAITHLRTTFTTDTTHDALMTRIIEDQVFIDIRTYLKTAGFLQQGNTPQTRARIQSGVEARLHERISWIAPVTQPDGSQGYNVSVASSPDQRQITVGYEGQIVRGVQTIQVNGQLTITV